MGVSPAVFLFSFANYEGSTDYKLALKSAFYDFTGTRDFYREATTVAGLGMNRDLIVRYIELQVLVLTPIASHWADYIWQEVLDKVDARFFLSFALLLRQYWCLFLTKL